jgi:nucleoid-associated protein YgaU
MRKLKRLCPKIKCLIFVNTLALLLAGPAWAEFSVLPGEEPRPKEREQSWEETEPMWEEEAVQERVTVQAGETLSEIADRVYGDAGKWHLIYNANRDRLTDPDHVPAGIELVIPAQ